MTTSRHAFWRLAFPSELYVIEGGGWRHKRAARTRTCAGTAYKTILAPTFTSPVATQATRLKRILPERLARFQADNSKRKTRREIRRFHRFRRREEADSPRSSQRVAEDKEGGTKMNDEGRTADGRECTRMESGSGIAAIPVPLMCGAVTARDAFRLSPRFDSLSSSSAFLCDPCGEPSRLRPRQSQER